jgi:DNA polymerase-3 subunit epsilon
VLDFTALDLETANSQHLSACAAGYAIVKNGQIVDTGSTLIKPVTGRKFEFTNVHGIKYRHVARAPGWMEFTNTLLAAQERHGAMTDPFLAFNSAFEHSVWKTMWEHHSTKPPHSNFYNVSDLSRVHLELDSYRLSEVVTALGIPDYPAKDAGAKALAVAQVVLSLAERTGASSVTRLWSVPSLKSRKAVPGLVTPDVDTSPSLLPRHLKRAPLKKAAQFFIFPPKYPIKSHPLHGSTVCLSGELEHFTRKEIIDLLESFGATVSNTVTERTDFLVTNATEPVTVPHRKALAAQKRGHQVRIVDEAGLVSVFRTKNR